MALCPISLTPVFANGVLQVGAVVEVFDASTTTPRTAYRNSGFTSSYSAADLRTNASGRVPLIYIQGTTSYRVRLTTAGGVLIEDIDGITADATASEDGGGGGGGSAVTGRYEWFHGTGTITGYVRANGRTIGSATSGATERANSDCQALFEWLWNRDSALAVSGGRGASAAADWAANKTITLPDVRGRVLAGLDDMGGSAAGRFTGVTFAAGNATTLGSTLGTSTHTLLAAQMPVHSHANTASASTSTSTSVGIGTLSATGSTSVTYPDWTVAITSLTVQDGVTQGILMPSSFGGDVARTVFAQPTSVTLSGAPSASSSSSTTVAMSNADAGSGSAHNNTQPTLLATCYLGL